MPCCNLVYYIVVQAVSSVSTIGFNPLDAVDWSLESAKDWSLSHVRALFRSVGSRLGSSNPFRRSGEFSPWPLGSLQTLFVQWRY